LIYFADGETTADMKSVLMMTDKPKTELPRMLEEHNTIVATLEKLANAAGKEEKRKHIDFPGSSPCTCILPLSSLGNILKSSLPGRHVFF